jgi:hypothetical protein
VLAWTVGVSLVLLLLLIWSALYRDSLKSRCAENEQSPARPDGRTAEGTPAPGSAWSTPDPNTLAAGLSAHSAPPETGAPEPAAGSAVGASRQAAGR